MSAKLFVEKRSIEKCCETCCREVLEKSVVEKCWRRVLYKSVVEKCWRRVL